VNVLVKRILKKIGRDTITFFTKIRRNRILFIQESASGSNSYALWKLAGDNIKMKYELILCQESGDEGNGFAHFVEKYRLIASAQLIVTTHGSYKPSRKHIHLQLWHGASIKKLGVMEKERTARFQPPWERVDYIMSYSETYTTFLNACMVTDPGKYIITGAPRNDFLFLSNGLSNIRKIFGDRVEGNRCIFFLPTYRDYYGKKQGDRNYDNPFGFKEFSPEKFDNFLKEKKLVVIFKPHPHEETLVLNYFQRYPLSNMLFLRDEDLAIHQLDLYELLNASEILITDYSSAFDDYLLLDRPIIFAPVDLDSYKKRVGFVIESFESWVPGPKVFDQNALQTEISRCLSEKDYYKEQRSQIRNLQHRYKDGGSSRRLWEFIDSILAK